MLLKFGIPSLDELIDTSTKASAGNANPNSAHPNNIEAPYTESIAILGSEGTGKSVIALHLASHYAADCMREIVKERSINRYNTPALEPPDQASSGENMDPPRILYISSDLKRSGAEKIWKMFKLNAPNSRHIPFERTKSALERSQSEPNLKLILKDLSPLDPDGIVAFMTSAHLMDDGKQLEIGFLDLASHTAGDDWTFVNALLVKLQSVPSMRLDREDRQLPHLVVIDSVAGFETFVGTVDAYGNEQTRRSRIAQCIRNAGDRVNLLFVVEEAHNTEHLPEEYVTDVVFSMNKKTVSSSTIVTVEIQKARSRDHAKGEHPFEIRGGSGTTTGDRDNVDDSQSGNAYVEVFHSLAHRNHVMSASREKRKNDPNDTVSTFGLQYLNDLLHRANQSKKYGLKAGTTTALIGDPSTGKSALGERFLAWGLTQMAKDFVCLYALRASKDEFPDVKNIPRAQNGFARISLALGESIIQMRKSSPQEEIIEDDQGPLILMNSWKEVTRHLCRQVQNGVLLTRRDLKTVIDKDHQKDEDLYDWSKLIAATNLIVKAEGNNGPNEGSCAETDSSEHKGKAPMFQRSDGTPPQVNLDEDDAPQPQTRTMWHGFPDDNGDFLEGPEGLVKLFEHPNLQRPGILLTTTDRRSSELAEQCFRQFLPQIEDALEILKLDKTQHLESIRIQLIKILERQLIVRRFDMHGVPAPAILHLIFRNLVEANRLIFGIASPHSRDRRHFKCDRIRLVIDDLRVLTKINPEIIEDGGFLSFLTMFLEQEGIISLILHTDRMLPYRMAEDETSQALLSVLKRAILTWNVPFEGRHRIAISVMPHNEPDKHGVVRELTIDKDGIPDVTRKLELYSGIEEGQPVQVPLAVYIFNETPQCESYINTEDKLFREVFKSAEDSSPIHPGRVIFPIDAERLLSLRDYTHLPHGSQLPHTAVFPVDEYWALSEPHVLDNLYVYLRGDFRDNINNQKNEDPFGIFTGDPRKTQPVSSGALTRGRTRRRLSRQDFFVNKHYSLMSHVEFPSDAANRIEEPRECRIPFMWDFGFLLVRNGPWETAKDESLISTVRQRDVHATRAFTNLDVSSIIPVTAPDEEERAELRTEELFPKGRRSNTKVQQVLDALSAKGSVQQDAPISAGETIEEMGYQQRVAGISWRKFFGACHEVASVHYRQTGAIVSPFDIASPSSETINALVLEIWRSELLLESRILYTGKELAHITKQLSPQFHKKISITDILKITCASISPEDDVGKRVEPALEDSIERRFKSFRGKDPKFWSNDSPESGELRLQRFRELPLGAFCLYKTWLLLLEAIQFEDFLEPGDSFAFRQGRTASQQSIASRQWYKTACAFSNDLNNSASIHDSLSAVSLPGYYTTRGDWFLGTAKSSRSKLLAQNAIDLLSSRRANITRLQHGLGLPVRDIVPEKTCSSFRTALRCKLTRHDAAGQPQTLLTEMQYGELCDLGVKDRIDFHWQFRSEIEDYDRLSRPLQKWLGRLFRWTGDYKKSRTRGWIGGFGAYDELTCKQFRTVANFNSFLEFGNMCDLLLDELETAKRGTYGSHSTQPSDFLRSS